MNISSCHAATEIQTSQGASHSTSEQYPTFTPNWVWHASTISPQSNQCMLDTLVDIAICTQLCWSHQGPVDTVYLSPGVWKCLCITTASASNEFLKNMEHQMDNLPYSVLRDSMPLLCHMTNLALLKLYSLGFASWSRSSLRTPHRPSHTLQRSRGLGLEDYILKVSPGSRPVVKVHTTTHGPPQRKELSLRRLKTTDSH